MESHWRSWRHSFVFILRDYYWIIPCRLPCKLNGQKACPSHGNNLHGLRLFSHYFIPSLFLLFEQSVWSGNRYRIMFGDRQRFTLRTVPSTESRPRPTLPQFHFDRWKILWRSFHICGRNPKLEIFSKHPLFFLYSLSTASELENSRID